MQRARPFASAALLAALAALSTGWGDAGAQQVFRIVGPDGRVTFSDKPPLEPAGRTNTSQVAARAAAGANVAGLPYELRQVSARYPVTLYTAPSCNACDAGRALLTARGVPFAERTITSAADFDALKRLANTNAVPLLTIGAQQIKGFGEAEWRQYLDAAGYPATSQLPRGYVQSAPAPMVALEEVRPLATRNEAAAAQGAAEPAPAAAQAAPQADNPAGIRF